jgi:hypothetical protein
VLVALAVVLGASCAEEAGYRKEPRSEEDVELRRAFVAAHPELLPDVKAALLRFEVTPQEVLRRLEYVRSRPAASVREKAAQRRILAGDVSLGMTADEVLASWGEPTRRVAQGAEEETWTYARPRRPTFQHDAVDRLTFREGRLIAVRRNVDG